MTGYCQRRLFVQLSNEGIDALTMPRVEPEPTLKRIEISTAAACAKIENVSDISLDFNSWKDWVNFFLTLADVGGLAIKQYSHENEVEVKPRTDVLVSFAAEVIAKTIRAHIVNIVESSNLQWEWEHLSGDADRWNGGSG